MILGGRQYLANPQDMERRDQKCQNFGARPYSTIAGKVYTMKKFKNQKHHTEQQMGGNITHLSIEDN